MTRRELLRGVWPGRGRDRVAWQQPVAEPTASVPQAATSARIQVHRCLAWLGSFCSTCVERCPLPGAIVEGPRGPVVQADACDGCGLCQQACPAPINAVRMIP